MASVMAGLTSVFLEHLVKPTFHPDFPLDKQRKRLDFIQKLAPMPFGVEKTVMTLAGVPAWQLTPKNPSANQLLYLHGGGYVFGSPQSHGDVAARIAKETGLTTTLIDYRLAPEFPFPAGLDDALAAYKALSSQDGAVYIAGDSAGGGMTLALMQRIREEGLPSPKALITLSPWADLSCSGDSFTERLEREKLLVPEWAHKAASLYLNDSADASNPLVSPVNADFEGFPPTLIQVGSEEILYSDSTRLYERMQSTGVNVTLSEYPQMWHVFQLHAGYMPEAKQALHEIGRFVRDLEDKSVSAATAQA